MIKNILLMAMVVLLSACQNLMKYDEMTSNEKEEENSIYVYLPMTYDQPEDILNVDFKVKKDGVLGALNFKDTVFSVSHNGKGELNFGSILGNKKHVENIKTKYIDGKTYVKVPFYVNEYDFDKENFKLYAYVELEGSNGYKNKIYTQNISIK